MDTPNNGLHIPAHGYLRHVFYKNSGLAFWLSSDSTILRLDTTPDRDTTLLENACKAAYPLSKYLQTVPSLPQKAAATATHS